MDVRKHVLKPLHRWLHAFAPDTADWVRSQWNQVSHEISVWRVLRKDKEEPRRATLLIDVSKICMRDAGTGIQRVVRAVVRELDAMGAPVLPCQVYHHALVTGHRFFQTIKGENAASGEESFVQIQSGDDLLLLDASFEFARELGEAVDEVHAKGGKVYAVIYDLLPIQAPEDFSSSYDVRVFCNWITMILSKADVLLCISRTVADAVVRLYLRDEEVRRARAGRALLVDAFPMGVDITEPAGEAREAVRPMTLSQSMGERPLPGRLTVMFSSVKTSPARMSRAATMLLRATTMLGASASATSLTPLPRASST